MKTIKIFDGIRLTAEEEVEKYPDMTVFDEVIKCTEEQRGEIIRALLMNGGNLDLSQCTTDGRRCILNLYRDETEEANENEIVPDALAGNHGTNEINQNYDTPAEDGCQ